MRFLLGGAVVIALILALALVAFVMACLVSLLRAVWLGTRDWFRERRRERKATPHHANAIEPDVYVRSYKARHDVERDRGGR